jgi:hypothetical protein
MGMKANPEPEPQPTNFTRDLLSNRSLSAMVRDDELAAANAAVPPTDLRAIPRDRWNEYRERDVTLPPAVLSYLAGAENRRLTEAETNGLIDQVAAFHDVESPWYIAASPTLRRTGRAWSYVPEIAPFVTGFYLEKEDE